jgi:transporter family protein
MTSNFFHSWLFYALGAALFAALTTVLGKVSVEKINSDLATFIRTVIVLGVTALFVTVKAQWLRLDQIPLRALTLLTLSGITTGLSWLCYYKALQLGPASRVAPIDKLSVVLVLAISFVVLGESFSWKIALGGALITAGVVLIAVSE